MLRSTTPGRINSVLPSVQELLHRCIGWLASCGDLHKEVSMSYTKGYCRDEITVASLLDALKVMGIVLVVMAFGVPAMVWYTV